MGSSASVIAEVVTDVKDRLPDLQPAPEMDDPDSTRFRLFDSITSFLKTASNTRPLVLVLDDLHWSDRPSLTFLEFMAREIGQSRLLIVATYRDMELNRRHPLSVTLGDLSRERLFERVLLRGLSEADIARFIEIASGINAPQELSATIRRHTEGNPLFVTEVVRELVQSGELAANVSSGSSTWSVRIPEGVREVIGRRLDRLSERANEMPTTAAVVGRDFRLDTLKGLVENTTEGQLLDVLDESLDAKIIEELSDAVGHYQFTHALMQETLTSELSLTRRVRLHARIAETLEALYGDQVEENASELAYHYVEAEAVLGSEKLLRYSVVAGEQAMQANGPEEALAHFERAEAALTGAEDDPLTGRVWFGLGVSRCRHTRWSALPVLLGPPVRAFDWFLEHEDTKSAVAVSQYPVIMAVTRGTVDLHERALLLVPPDSLDAGFIGERMASSLIADRGDVEGAILAGERSLSIGIATEQGPSKPVPDG
jgi:predicted ATPase